MKVHPALIVLLAGVGLLAACQRAAPDAVEVDTSVLDLDAVLTQLTELAARRGLVGCAAHAGANGG